MDGDLGVSDVWAGTKAWRLERLAAGGAAGRL
jgi:hypothetical protein